jgi:hypothetical protein
MDKTQIETQGYRQLVTDHCSLVARVVNLEMRIAELEYLLSEELMRSLATPADLRETVAELGHGWRVERQLTPPNESGATSAPYPVAADGVTADSWLSGDDWVTQFAADADGK